jgi:hypothetical protein
MSNKNPENRWKPGQSGNMKGRPKINPSSKTPEGMIRRFLIGILTQKELKRLYKELDAKGKLSFLTEILPYCAPKLSQQSLDLTFENLSDRDINRLYDQVISGIGQSLQIESPMRLPEAIEANINLEVHNAGTKKKLEP